MLALLLFAFASVPTFHQDVLPILERRCQGCHRPGDIGPMSLMTYAEARPWAKAIREAVITRKMPPWFADPRYGHFANDRSLTKAEIDTIAAWAAGGAPAGPAPPGGHSPLASPPGWHIGRPDVVLTMPQPFPIPAAGAIDYQYIIFPSHLTADTWVQKVEVQPGVRSAVHHAVVYVRPPGSDWLRGKPAGVPFASPLAQTRNDILLVYTPGNSWDSWPAGMAKKIPAGSDIVLQMHYTATGNAQADRTRIAIVTARERPRQAVVTLQMSNDRFVIPPGDANYRIQVTGTLPNDALLLSMFPHMHLRGKGFEYMIVGGEGRLETLLKVDHYDFNWQLNYKLAQPIPLRAGTRLLCAAYFDNSANNPRNPDPSAEVRYGEQSWEEMMIGFFDVAIPADTDKIRFFERPPSAKASRQK